MEIGPAGQGRFRRLFPSILHVRPPAHAGVRNLNGERGFRDCAVKEGQPHGAK